MWRKEYKQLKYSKTVSKQFGLTFLKYAIFKKFKAT